MADLRVAVIGAGMIGQTHVDALQKVAGLKLSAIADPAREAVALAERLGVPHFGDPGALIGEGLADAVIIATPNETHLTLGRAALQAGLPVLMEKPLAADAGAGEALAAAVRGTGVPLLVGHHRRHHPVIKAAKAAIADGAIGRMVTATVMSVLSKPPGYFAGWRVTPGDGGPILINATHEVDLLRHFFGAVETVAAVASNARRKKPVEDSAAAILTFERGGIATITLTDAAAGPWAWDMTAGENPARFPVHDTIAHAYAGTEAALSLPDLRLWRHPGAPDWTTEMTATRLEAGKGDVYVAQLEHFREVALGRAEPLVSAADAVETMRVIEAIFRSAAENRRVRLND